MSRGVDRAIVQGVRRDTHGKGECQQGGDQPLGIDVGSQSRTDEDIRQVPGGIGRVEDRNPVAPFTRRRGVPRRAALRTLNTHGRRSFDPT